MAFTLHSARSSFAIIALVVLATGQTNSAAQSNSESADSSKATRVALGSNSGPPSSELVIPIYFTPAPGSEVGRLKVEINFVSVNLRFDGIDRGVAAKIPNLDFSSDVQASKNAKGLAVSTVTLQVSFSPSAARDKGIPGGILGYLKLWINENAKSALVTLRTKAEGNLLGSDAKLSNLQTSDGQAQVAWLNAPPNVSCFFFTH